LVEGRSVLLESIAEFQAAGPVNRLGGLFSIPALTQFGEFWSQTAIRVGSWSNIPRLDHPSRSGRA
jgi:hypothetical protein